MGSHRVGQTEATQQQQQQLPSLTSFLPVCFPFSSPCVLTASLCLFLRPFPFHLPLCPNNWVHPSLSFSFFLIVSPCLPDSLFTPFSLPVFLNAISTFLIFFSVFTPSIFYCLLCLPFCLFCRLFCPLSPPSVSPCPWLSVCPSLCFCLFTWQFVSYSSFCLSLSVFLSLCICLPLTISLSVSVSSCLCGGGVLSAVFCSKISLLLTLDLTNLLSVPHSLSHLCSLSVTCSSSVHLFNLLFYRIVTVNILCIWDAQNVHRGILHFWRKYSITWHLLESVQTASAK